MPQICFFYKVTNYSNNIVKVIVIRFVIVVIAIVIRFVNDTRN